MPLYNEGDVAENPDTGEVKIYTNGKWELQQQESKPSFLGGDLYSKGLTPVEPVSVKDALIDTATQAPLMIGGSGAALSALTLAGKATYKTVAKQLLSSKIAKTAAKGVGLTAAAALADQYTK